MTGKKTACNMPTGPKGTEKTFSAKYLSLLQKAKAREFPKGSKE